MKLLSKKIMLILCIAIILGLFVSPAAAYVDPTIMTYAIQAVAGVIIIAGVTVGVIWRRMKRKAQKVLHIDENAKKEVEDDVVEFSEDGKNV